jgi:hypothetical protein
MLGRKEMMASAAGSHKCLFVGAPRAVVPTTIPLAILVFAFALPLAAFSPAFFAAPLV